MNQKLKILIDLTKDINAIISLYNKLGLGEVEGKEINELFEITEVFVKRKFMISCPHYIPSSWMGPGYRVDKEFAFKGFAKKEAYKQFIQQMENFKDKKILQISIRVGPNL